MPISYTKRGWTNNLPPAINAANLGAMDDGLTNAVNALNNMGDAGQLAVKEIGAAPASTTGGKLVNKITEAGYSLAPATGTSNLDNIADGTSYRRVQAAIVDALHANSIPDSGRKFRMLAGVIRKSSTYGWYFIGDGDGTSHAKLNFTTISATADYIQVNYGFTASKVSTFLIVPDETYAPIYSVGASVGLSSSQIYLYKFAQSLGLYIYYDGLNWVVLGGSGNETATFNNGILTISHPSMIFVDGFGCSVSLRNDTVTQINIFPTIGSVGTTTSPIYIHDQTGALITTPNTDMKFWLNRSQTSKQENPLTMLENDGGNFWIFGLMEV